MYMLNYINYTSRQLVKAIQVVDNTFDEQEALYEFLCKSHPHLSTDELDFESGSNQILINKQYVNYGDFIVVGDGGLLGDEISQVDELLFHGSYKLQQTFVLFNGAPNSGKDTAADMMKDEIFGEGLRLNFKDALYVETYEYFCVEPEIAVHLFRDRELKEKPTKLFKLGLDLKNVSWLKRAFLWLRGYKPKYLSPRQALIHVSENVIKPNFGDSFFGDTLLSGAESHFATEFIFVGDSGFLSELEPLVEAGHKVFIVQLHRDGCTFKGDSRGFIEPDDVEHLGIKVIKLDNNDGIAELKSNLLNLSTYEILGG